MVVLALEARGVAKIYRQGSPAALAGVEIAIPQGSITALVGPNGAGKSTLMKTWMGFERPTSGRVLVHGMDPFVQRADVMARIGYIPQRPALYREFTVGDHLDLASSLRPSFDRGLAIRRLDDLRIPTRQLAGELSGGQQAQVSLALVLAAGADTLLLDEPLAALDPLARSEFIYLLVESLHDRGATAVLTSHIATDVEQAADRMIVLGAGQKLLDCEISAALATHRICVGDPPAIDGVTPVASFLGPGEIFTLVEIATSLDAIGSLRAATVEDLMLGYLAAGRPSMVERVRSGLAGH